jgi:hypothetical protein
MSTVPTRNAPPLSETLATLASADTLTLSGRRMEAVALLMAAIRRQRSPELERHLARLRTGALPAPHPAAGAGAAASGGSIPLSPASGLPEIAGDALTPSLIADAIRQHGSLLVRGLLSPAEADTLRRGVENAFDAKDAWCRGVPEDQTNPWYAPLPLDAASSESRDWVEDGGGVWTADSPRVMFDLLDLYERHGLIDIITAHLGERPVISVNKSTLRKVPRIVGTDWHQDGAFLGTATRTLNVWLALSPCGEDAAGLDVIPRRIPYVLQTGSHGAFFDWAVGPGMVDILAAGGGAMVSPVFRPGDAMLFDQLMLHRTGKRDGLAKPRFAIETWFFAPSTYPADQIPIIV